MKRRAFLSATGGLAGLAGLSGCLGDGGSTPNGEDPDPTDGYPPAFESTPKQRSVDTGSFGTVERDGVAVPLAPVDVAHYWHRRREARFADARGETQYEQSHVLGAVLSPAPDGRESDPIGDWPTDDRIVAYCGCPHHLSSMRAAALIDAGYENVYVIDEGFWTWHDRGYPMAGTEVTARPSTRVVRGQVDPASAGATAWAVHEPTGQREAGPIADDGSYHLELTFVDVTATSPIRLRTPEYEFEAPLGTLTDGVVTRSTA